MPVTEAAAPKKERAVGMVQSFGQAQRAQEVDYSQFLQAKAMYAPQSLTYNGISATVSSTSAMANSYNAAQVTGSSR